MEGNKAVKKRKQRQKKSETALFIEHFLLCFAAKLFYFVDRKNTLLSFCFKIYSVDPNTN